MTRPPGKSQAYSVFKLNNPSDIFTGFKKFLNSNEEIFVFSNKNCVYMYFYLQIILLKSINQRLLVNRSEVMSI